MEWDPTHQFLTIHKNLSQFGNTNNVVCDRMPSRRVHELPSDVEVLAWSDKTRVEMFRYGSHIMGVQGYPEYTNDILLQLIDRLLQRNFIEDVYICCGSEGKVEDAAEYGVLEGAVHQLSQE